MSISFKNYRNLKIGIFALLFAAGSLQAAELSVIDGQGVPYLRVDAADGSNFDLNVQFDNANLADAAELSLTNKMGDTRKFSVNSSDLTNGVSIQKVSLGEYVISSNSDDLKIKTVNVVDSKVAKATDASSDETIGTTAYVVGAAAVAGGAIAAVTAGSGGDIFSSGGGSSDASTSKGVGELNAEAIHFVDPNTPPVTGFGNAPTFIAAPTPTPYRLETPTGGNPIVAPPPPIGNPMTPS